MQETNVLGFRGPRKMTVVLPGMTEDHQRADFKPASVRPIMRNVHEQRLIPGICKK